MGRYRLGKPQVRRLINDSFIMDGHGRKYTANKELKETLKEIDDSNTYNEVDILMYDGGIEVRKKNVTDTE